MLGVRSTPPCRDSEGRRGDQDEEPQLSDCFGSRGEEAGRQASKPIGAASVGGALSTDPCRHITSEPMKPRPPKTALVATPPKGIRETGGC